MLRYKIYSDDLPYIYIDAILQDIQIEELFWIIKANPSQILK